MMRPAILIKAIAGVAALIWCLSGFALGVVAYVHAADQAEIPVQRVD